MKKKNNNKVQITTSATSEALILDSETRSKLRTISSKLDRIPSEVIEEFVHSLDRFYSLSKNNGNGTTKENPAFMFDFINQHLHLLPQIAESISLLSGRDTDIVIGHLDIVLDRNAVTFDLGLGLYDLEKVFVTMEEGHIQLFSNRYLSDRYTIKEIEKIREQARKYVKESVPYADVTIGIVKTDNGGDKKPDSSSRAGRSAAAGKIINIKEVELTIRSNNIQYVPMFHKFNTLMDDVIYYFEKHIEN
jgi:hypothetical protein